VETTYPLVITRSNKNWSNTQAIDFDNLADGMVRFSAVGKQAGMTMEQVAGVLTGGYEILGDSEKVASGLITISTRLQSIQMEGEETVETTAKLQKSFSNATKGAVNIVDQSTGQLRDVYSILSDLNKVWGTLDKNTQEALAFSAAGTRQKSVFLSIMSNWSSVEKSVKSATNSMGSADIENTKVMNSISGKLEKLKSSFQELSSNLVNSDALKVLVAVGTKILDFLNLGDGIILKIAAVTAGFILLKATMTTLSGVALFKNIGAIFTGLTSGIKNIIALLTLAKTETISFGTALELLNINPVILAITAAVAIVGGTLLLVDALTTSVAEQTKKVEEANTAYAESQTKLESVNSELDKASKRIDELNKKDKLTFVEKGELEKLVATTAELKKQQLLAQTEAKEKGKTATDAAVKLINQYQNRDRYTGEVRAGQEVTSLDRRNAFINGYGYTNDTEKDAIPKMISRYKELYDLKAKLEKDGNTLNKDQTTEFDSLSKSLTDLGTEYQKAVSDIIPYDTATQKAKDDTLTLRDSIIEALNPTGYKAIKFDEIFNAESFENTKQELLDLAKAGKLDESTLSKYSTFKQDLQKVGITASEAVTQIQALTSLSPTTEISDFTTQLETANKAIEGYKDSVKDMVSESQAVQSAFDEQADSGKLSNDTIMSLIDSGYAMALQKDKVTGAYTLNAEAIERLNKEKVQENLLDIANQKLDLTTKYNAEKKEIDELTTSLQTASQAEYGFISQQILAKSAELGGFKEAMTQLDAYADIYNNLGNNKEKKDSKKSDPNQDAYEKAMANHIHLHNMQLESDTDFYNAMEQANETYYKNDIDHLKDYNTNIETIYNGRNDIIKQAFEDEKEIASNGNSGSIADQKKYLETLSKLNEEYYKGKTQFGKEYIATQKEIAKGQADLIKQENESQIDYVNSMKDKFDKAADDKINALKAQNDLADKQLEKQQHLLDLEEKEIALKHAQEKTRMIVSDSGIEYDTNLDDIKNAEQDVAKAKQAIEQDKVDEQVTALEEAKKTGDNIYDVLLEMYKVLAGKDITPTKSDPEVEARLKQATTIDKDGTTLVNGTPITPLSETNPLFGGIPLLPNFNQGNFNMDNILGNPLSKLGDLGAVTNNSKTSSYVYSFDGANFNLPSVKNPADFLKQLPSLLDNSTAQINGKTN